MDLNYIKKLMKLLAASEVGEIEVEEDGKRIRISKSSNNAAPSAGAAGPTSTILIPHQSVAASSTESALAVPSPAAKGEKKYHEIISPIVGTFYRAAAPDANPYVEVGQAVQPGVVLCIIEAMKLMNEIESDVAGRIVKIHAENGQPVEYNQPLFSIELM